MINLLATNCAVVFVVVLRAKEGTTTAAVVMAVVAKLAAILLEVALTMFTSRSDLNRF